ncbi:hypothetical protein CGMCC3_g16789 [Colletotrichum fructicola]|nr:uncharacterized protein CGMCC3_g16789 [Colletotrichum fructicola]KAE9567070.1 hypothetical protein CGMCC3_g16789 [Colletotrichum fructicola]
MPNATSTSLWQTESRTKDHANLQYQSSAIGVGDSSLRLQHCLRKRKQPRQPDVDQLGANQFGIHEGFGNKRFPLGDARQRAPQASVSTHPVSLFPIHRTKGSFMVTSNVTSGEIDRKSFDCPSSQQQGDSEYNPPEKLDNTPTILEPFGCSVSRPR